MEKREDKTWAGGANPNAGPLGNQVGVLGLERCDTVIIYIYIYIYKREGKADVFSSLRDDASSSLLSQISSDLNGVEN
jgi:hypothetical protein